MWEKTANANSSGSHSASTASAAPRKKKRSTYSSDDCVSCGSIALAGQDQCISCTTGSRKSSNSSTNDSDALKESDIILPAVPKFMPRFSLSSGGKGPNIVTTRKLSSAECSQLIEREILYIKYIQNKIPAMIRTLIGKAQEGQELVTCLGSMTYDQIAQHLMSLRVEPIQKLFRPVLTKFMQHPRNLQGVFNRPVDISQEGLTDYLEKIAVPMDLRTVRGKLQRGQFETLHTSINEIRLVFQNAMAFNPPGHTIHILAKGLATELETDIALLEENCVKDTERKISHPTSCKLCGGEQCNICGEKCIKLETPVLLCHGSCIGRIKRNSVYYVSNDGMMLWCQRCYSGLPQCVAEANPKAEPPRAAILKKELIKCKSDEEVSEPWVECDTCHKWVHQICGLYNDRFEEGEELDSDGNNIHEHTTAYQCPRCRLESCAVESVQKQQELDQLALAGTLRRGKKRIKDENTIEKLTSTGTGKQNSSGISHSTGISIVSPSANHLHAIKIEPNITISDKKRSREVLHAEGDADCTDADDDSLSNTSTPNPLDKGFPTSQPIYNTTSLISPDLNISGYETLTSRAAATHRQWSAKALPRSRLSDFIESMVKQQLRSTGYEHVIPSITIRMTSNVDQYVEVPEPMLQNLMTADGNELPKFLEYKQKCILLFQNIEGVDICLFSLYVQEFGVQCPAPNKGCVYISYLDSVDYLRPIEVRTMVYHEIMVAYLKWSQLRGFTQAHIWSCPPQRGDNFIFWCHPTHQRTPSRERLNGWYTTMLERAMTLGIIDDISNLFEEYFAPYLRNERELSETRQAAKNSFVGTGKVVRPGQESHFAASLKAQREAAEEAREARESGEPNGPISAPIFEGDYWVNEFLRMHRVAISRTATEDGQDRDLNRRKARDWLKQLLGIPSAAPFNKPVDPVAIKAPDYFKVITQPMDLTTIREKLRLLQYENLYHVAEDVRLTFRNAMTYNPPGHFIYGAAQKLLEIFENICHSTVHAYSNGMDSDEMLTIQEIDTALATYPVAGPTTGTAAAAAAAAAAGAALAAKLQSNDHGSADIDDESTDAGHAMNYMDPTENNSVSSSQRSPRAGSEPRVSFVNEGTKLGPTDTRTRTRSNHQNQHFDDTSGTVASHASGEIDSHGDDNFSHNDSSGHPDPEGDLEDEESSVCGSHDMPARAHLRRQDSIESTMSATTNGSGDEWSNILSRRPFHSGAMQGHANFATQTITKFTKPVIGMKAIQNVMNDLAKGVERLKSDLFVVYFASPDATILDRDAATARREARQLDAAIAEAESKESQRLEKEIHNRRNKKNRQNTKHTKTTTTRKPLNTSGNMIVQNDTTICEDCLILTRGLIPDTSDPDMNIASPFIDSRHTFLEMCQFRHYQFDSLRRAKHSSQMVLFHLHNPYGANTRPTCVVCKGVIRDVRWHCGDGCADSDTCQECYFATEHIYPEHKLTPYRVSIV